MACVVRAEKLILPTLTAPPLHHTYILCLLYIHANPCWRLMTHQVFRKVQVYWLGVWALMPVAWVQILALPLISRTTMDGLLNLMAPYFCHLITMNSEDCWEF